MKMVFIWLSLILVYQLGHAQHVVSMFDGEGNEIGTPSFKDPTNPVVVIRPDGLGMLLNLKDLTLREVSLPRLWYGEPDCAGQPHLLLDSLPPVAFNFLAGVSNSGLDGTFVVVLVIGGSETSIVIKSKTGAENEPACLNQPDDYRPVQPATIINPVDYGLIQIAPNDRWGYPGPMEIRTTKVMPAGEVIFCNGFEQCPSE